MGIAERTIKIDGRQYQVKADHMTGEEIRALAGLPPDDDRDLYVELPGLAADRLLKGQDDVELSDAVAFFSVPRRIHAGSGR